MEYPKYPKSVKERRSERERSTKYSMLNKPIPPGVTPELSSIIMMTANNIILSPANNYELFFNVGSLEGSGLTVDRSGRNLTFLRAGTYRFELIGCAVPYSNGPVRIVYHSRDHPSDVRPFTEFNLTPVEGRLMLNQATTMFPLSSRQTLVVRIIAPNRDSINVLKGARLIIHRTA